jgi:hypothetical protein
MSSGIVYGVLKRELIDMFTSYHVGKERAVTVGRIARSLGHKDTGLTNPQLRSVIRDILMEGEYPIGSCSRGYYMITTEGERQEYLANLRKRRDGINSRIECLEKMDLWQTG